MQPNTFVYALFHWISWVIVLGGGIGALNSGHSQVFFGALVVWALWLTVGARAQFFQRYVALKNGKKSELKRQLASMQKQQQMSYEYTGRYRELEKVRKQILESVKSNKRLEQEIIQPEIDKIDTLLDAFVRTAVAHKKVAKYVADNPEAALSTERMRIEAELGKGASDASVKDNLLAQKDMIEKRITERAKMVHTAQQLAVQLDTIEKTLLYLKSKITAMETPAQLQQEISSVVAGLEAAERTLVETDKIEEEARRMAQRFVAS